mmetsp:Transcript_96612/g.201921  ORF Transcript_96612/g.201921 Transcript_96612/m.201921 type:complete len:645 (-) Transcript_96612:97-2031(-)|eukprot:CAMPEP_0206494170 /NCGR_PEP_ID=MMETSP0324_2-20121206/47536_1 /ASSEMBLY_ACC=CAM_ASM_000836 /TAXON_ID=2866 /ORGANISM="Crypthecodinium cohnii, Strain Seligo" /LENGTH=644 /DNA_ID=CAMNT_0053977709 /DNA_START=43 /DNA_END=1977 /DNA_ORIENTATION=+
MAPTQEAVPVDEVYKDVAIELETAKNHFDKLYAKDVEKCAEAVTDWCSWNLEWFAEPLPLENSTASALEHEVRELAMETCARDEVLPLPNVEPPPEENVLIFTDQGGFCHRLLDKVHPNRIGSKRLISSRPEELGESDFQSLLGQKVWDLVIIGFPLDPPDSSEVDAILSHQSAVCKALFTFLKVAYLKEGQVKRAAVLTHDIFAEAPKTHAERGLELTTGGTLYGLCNTGRLECGFPLQLIDVEMTDCYELLSPVASELFRPSTFGVNTVRHCYPYTVKNGIRRDQAVGRLIARQVASHKYQEAKKEFEIPEEGIIAISGGNGALGLVMGNWLLDRAIAEKASSKGSYNPRFSIEFLSRSARVSEQNMSNWRKIQEKASTLGVTVSQGTMDMSTQGAVDNYVQKVTPNLIGFIHSAGILQDAMLPNQTWEKFEAVFQSKHWAAFYLHDALERYSNPNLKFFWMFSSTAVYGNMGQINYSASNSAMDALARHRLASGRPACAIQWGAWGEVGMAASMDDAMRRRVMAGPYPYFTVKQGLEGLEGGLRTGLPGFSVFVVNPPVFYQMIQEDQGHIMCYTRNFTSLWCPTPAPRSFDRSQTYNIFRMYRYFLAPYENDTAAVYTTYIKPLVEEEEKDYLELGCAYA